MAEMRGWRRGPVCAGRAWNVEVEAAFVFRCSESPLSQRRARPQAACDQPALAGEDNCFDRGSGFVGISVLAWHLTYWSGVGF